jgi:hypothetical protein
MTYLISCTSGAGDAPCEAISGSGKRIGSIAAV